MPVADFDEHARYSEQLVAAVREAGQLALGKFRAPLKSWSKDNYSPVSETDIAVNEFLQERLRDPSGKIGWLSEETADTTERLSKSRVWIVDPLDGTKEFTQHIPEFCVCVALVEEGVVQVGVSYNPAEDLLFAARRGGGTTLNGKPVRCTTRATVADSVVLASRSEDKRGEWDAYKTLMKVKLTGSVAYKFAQISAGMADATFSLTPKNEWDICAGTMLVEEAGGVVTDRFGKPLTFNNAKTLLPGLIAASSVLYGPLRDVILEVSGK